MQRQICYTIENFEKLDLVSTLGWESETTFPNVVGDVVGSFVGAIFVDSSFEKDTSYIFKHKASSCVCISKVWRVKYNIEGKR
uniref:RNase III domain-containing protein n=1 Tax=Solanum lycopersicum TaxID=4081 RepID=A0A3Q7EBL3_SOLLC